MMDIDLGPVLTAIFTIFIVVPGAIGLIVGILFGRFIFKKLNFSKPRKTALTLLCGFIATVLFPIIIINFEKQFSAYENNRIFEKTKQYEKELVQKHVVSDIKVEQDLYSITITVPSEGDYRLNVVVYQGSFCREIYNSPSASGTKSVKLISGQNTIKGNINDVQYLNRDACTSLYNRENSTIPANVKVATINPNSPMDFVVKINTPENKLLNDRKNLVVSNPNSVIKDGSLIIYSPRLSSDKNCPIYTYNNYSTCVAEDKLRLN